MSRRTITETNARMLPDGRPTVEITVGWAPPTQSYFILMESNRGPDKEAWRRGFLGELPTFEDLYLELEEMAEGGLIKWPLDPVLVEVLLDDRSENLSTNHQRWNEIEIRKGLVPG